MRCPALATALGRFDIAANILKTYAAFVDRGMLPNRFPDGGEAPEYNTADATLWMFHALSRIISRPSPVRNCSASYSQRWWQSFMRMLMARATGSMSMRKTHPACRRRRHPSHLLDAKNGEQVFTPRIGKPVEINALWLNALNVMVRAAGRVFTGNEKRFCESLLERGSRSFARFWNEERHCLYDVTDVEGTSCL